MLWRSKAAPRALKALADAACAAAGAANRYFAQPIPAHAQAALEARRSAGLGRRRFDEAVEQEPAPRSDWLEAASALAEAAEGAAMAAEEADRFDADLGALGPRLTLSLEKAVASLKRAVDDLEAQGAVDALIEAKNEALRIEEMRRRGRQAAMDRPALADELKAGAILGHFSRAAEAVHRAADILATRLVERS